MSTNRYQLSSFSVIIVFVCLCLIGFCLIPLLDIQLTPSQSPSSLSITYSWPDASARVIEQEVTSVLEGMFSSVKGIKDISSGSHKGWGSIDLNFKETVNLDAIRFEIAGLIRQSYPALPPQVSYPHLSLGVSGETERPILTYTLNASASPFYMQQYAKDHIAPQLSRIKGVHEVQVYGATPYEWEINFNLETMHSLGIRGDDIAMAVNHYAGKGFLGKGVYQAESSMPVNETTLILQGPGTDSLVWRNIPVKRIKDRIIYLTDVATVRYKEQLPQAYFRNNGLNTINIVIYPANSVNAIRLATKIRSEVQQLKTSLPPGYALLLMQDTTEFLSAELQTIALRSVLSLIMLMILVWVISRRYRYLLLIAISMIINLAIACVFYYAFDIKIHLYSLAGMTISFGIIIDNSIVMIDHLLVNRNRKVFPAITGATLTTIASLTIIFFLQEEQKENLVDLALVIIVNLSVSLAIACFLIPALMEKMPLVKRSGPMVARRKRRVIRMTRLYDVCIRFGKRWKWLVVGAAILGFGIPVHWLPDKVDAEQTWSPLYNKSLGSPWFKENIRPAMEKIVGGSLRLFTENVFAQSYYAEPSQTTLYVNGKMPAGCTVHQLNEAMEHMENFISQFNEVELFQTSVYSYQYAEIRIYFKKKYEGSNFPFFLKNALESKAISLGGATWSVYGVGQGFSNAIREGSKNERIILQGYNYEQLYNLAVLLKGKLLENVRIKEADIIGRDSWDAQTIQEYFTAFDAGQLAMLNIYPTDIYYRLRDSGYRTMINPVFIDGNMKNIYLSSDTYNSFNVWDFKHEPIGNNRAIAKLSQMGTIDKRKSGNDIYKNNQQYNLVVAYDFIGPYLMAQAVQEKHIDAMKEILPLGYSIWSPGNDHWNKDDTNQYLLILLIIVIIYFICAILFESLLKPLAIISLIPISFIGIFLTFYLFDVNFDQGGFASFVLVSGLVVSAGIFVVNDYNNLTHIQKPGLRTYLKAFNHKIIPILLSVFTTVVGLIPFMWEGQKEVFWFAFAAGTAGGLLFSIFAVLVYLPLFLSLKRN